MKLFSLYKGIAFHKRDNKKDKTFNNKVYWFSLDVLNESKRSKLAKFLYRLQPTDHIYFGGDNVSDNLITFLKEKIQNDEIEVESITYYGLLRSLGYLFNPVCLFIVKTKKYQYAIVEVGNTFGEIKPFLHQFSKEETQFDFMCPKYFYVSPFIQHNADFRFRFFKKDGALSFIAQTIEGDNILMNAGLNAKETNMSLLNPRLLIQSFLVISLIHLYAFILWIKGKPYFKKNEFTSFQKGMYLWKKH